MNVESLRGEAGRVIGFMYQVYTKATVAVDVKKDPVDVKRTLSTSWY